MFILISSLGEVSIMSGTNMFTLMIEPSFPISRCFPCIALLPPCNPSMIKKSKIYHSVQLSSRNITEGFWKKIANLFEFLASVSSRVTA